MVDTTITRRTRRARSVDVSTFAGTVADALSAFGHDVSYAVAMARAAVAIESKKRSYEARRVLRAAEAAAHAECSQHEFTCLAVSACGTGDCKFAEGELARLVVGAEGGKAHRPQPPYESYSLDGAVTALASLHGRAQQNSTV